MNTNNIRKRKLSFYGICALYLAASYSAFAGVTIAGENQDLGTVKQGKQFLHNLTIYNCTFDEIHINILPTCGCALHGIEKETVKPFSVKHLDIPYLLPQNIRGPQTRHELILYQRQNRYYRIDSTIHFNIES